MYPFTSPCHPGEPVCDLAFSAYVMQHEAEQEPIAFAELQDQLTEVFSGYTQE